MAGPRLRVTAAICAYNEAANIDGLLTTLLRRDGESFDEIIVVSSGSTDGTDDIVRRHAERDPRLTLVAEPERHGKAAAVNTVLSKASGDVILLIDADCLPSEGALAAMVRRLDAPGVGGVGARNLPVNGEETWVARCASLMWDAHHEVNLRHPVLGGDIVAFRNLVPQIPPATVNDDYAIEVTLREQALGIDYESEHPVLMRVPATVSDFLAQRRRIRSGYEAAAHRTAVKATNDLGLIAAGLVSVVRKHPASAGWLVPLLALEAAARIGVALDGLRGRGRAYTAWQPSASTKKPVLSNGRQPDTRA